jgi:hypothetical protein
LFKPELEKRQHRKPRELMKDKQQLYKQIHLFYQNFSGDVGYQLAFVLPSVLVYYHI